MARRPRSFGSRLYRSAVLADMRFTARSFPSEGLVASVRAVEAGAAVEVSGGRLHRGLLAIGEPGTADLFRARLGGERWFVLGSDDTLTEQPARSRA